MQRKAGVRLLTSLQSHHCPSLTKPKPRPRPRCQRRAVVVLCPRLAEERQGSLLDLTVVHGFRRGCRDCDPFIPPCRNLHSLKPAKGPCQASDFDHDKQAVAWSAACVCCCRVILSRETVTLDGLRWGTIDELAPFRRPCLVPFCRR